NVEFNARVMVGAATAFAMAHESGRAIDILEWLLEHPSAGLYMSANYLRGDPTWDSLRREARFQRMLSD
ncbi:MAG TPA: hypothetical protein VFZ04_15235, partial [Longimicrobiales bacterium]